GGPGGDGEREMERAGGGSAGPFEGADREDEDGNPANGVEASAQRGSRRGRRADRARHIAFIAAGDRYGVSVRDPAVGRSRDNQLQEPGGREVVVVGRHPLDRHGDQEDPISSPGRSPASPVATHDVRAALATR